MSHNKTLGKMSERTLLLLHGAGTGAWVWDELTKNLATPAVALDVPGRVEGATPEGLGPGQIRRTNLKASL